MTDDRAGTAPARHLLRDTGAVPLWLKITVAVVLGFMIIRLWPVARHLNQHGPKGSSRDWQAALIPLALVVGFVLLLIMLVRH